MGETLEDARRMMRAEAETGSFLQIGFELHYSTLYTTVKEWIDAGLIGRPVNCHCRYYCSEFHRKNTWRSNSSGTLIGEKLSHYLDLQRWWLDSPVKEVFAVSAPNVVDYFNHPDNHQIHLRFQNGAASSLNFVMYIGETDHTDPLLEMLDKQSDDGHHLQYHVFGTKGAIETDVFRRRIRRRNLDPGKPDRDAGRTLNSKRALSATKIRSTALLCWKSFLRIECSTNEGNVDNNKQP